MSALTAANYVFVPSTRRCPRAMRVVSRFASNVLCGRCSRFAVISSACHAEPCCHMNIVQLPAHSATLRRPSARNGLQRAAARAICAHPALPVYCHQRAGHCLDVLRDCVGPSQRYVCCGRPLLAVYGPLRHVHLDTLQRPSWRPLSPCTMVRTTVLTLLDILTLAFPPLGCH